jgi:NAD(P)H-hydrate epimerase
LTGIVAGLLARKRAPFDAARLAVYAHGLAGDIAAERGSQTALIARDVAEALPLAFRVLEGPPAGAPT